MAPSCEGGAGTPAEAHHRGLRADPHAEGQGDLGRALAGRLPGPVEVGTGVAGSAGGNERIGGPVAAIGQGEAPGEGRAPAVLVRATPPS